VTEVSEYNEDEEIEKLLEEKYRRYLYELEMRRLQEASERMKRKAEEEAIKKVILMKYVDEDVRQRIYNIRAVNPEFASKIENTIIALLQSGRVDRIDFNIFKQIVDKIKESL